MGLDVWPCATIVTVIAVVAIVKYPGVSNCEIICAVSSHYCQLQLYAPVILSEFNIYGLAL